MNLMFKMKQVSIFVFILLLCSFWVTFSNVGIMKAESNSLVTVNAEHFTKKIRKKGSE